MEIQKLALGMFQANCYVVSEGNEAFLVDPGDRPEEILDYLNNHGLDLKFILLTHGHLDHVNAVDGIVKVHKVPVYLHEADRQAIDQKVNVFGKMTSQSLPIHEGMTIPFAGHKISVIETPGHSEGGVCFLVDGNLFVGDTLFRHSIGRYDLHGSDGEALFHSIRKKLYKLPDDTKVYPGHEMDTDIGHEKKYNMFVKGKIQ